MNTTNEQQKTMKDGYYTKPQTSNTIAVINNVAFRVAYLPNKFTNEIDKVITNEKIVFLPSVLEDCIYEPFVR